LIENNNERIMEIYQDIWVNAEVHDSPHPPSSAFRNALKLLAEWRGANIGTRYAECFEMVRRII